MTTLIVGFDSAWTEHNSGAIVAALRLRDGTFQYLGQPQVANFKVTAKVVLGYAAQHSPQRILILLDQPTIVTNATSRRPVERIVSSSVGRRRGGMQPANTGRADMFGPEAPVWPFLSEFGGPADPLGPAVKCGIFETYPVLGMIALGWVLPDTRTAGRLPKYNPERRKTFAISDWAYVCERVSDAFRDRGLDSIAEWAAHLAKIRPNKKDQDAIDACFCLLVGISLAAEDEGLMVGNKATGYIVVPYGPALHRELDSRCDEIDLEATEWVRKFRLQRAEPQPE